MSQPWADAGQLLAALAQPWTMPESVARDLLQRYGIAAEVLSLTSEQLYHINQYTGLLAGLSQPYAVAGESARLYRLDTLLWVGGVRVPYVSLEWQAADSDYGWSCSFTVPSRAAVSLCIDGAEILIVHMGETFAFECIGGWLLDRRFGDDVCRVNGWSRTRALDGAAPLRGDLAGGMASQIVADLAAPFGVAVLWQMADGWISDGKLIASDQTPMALIRDLVADVGGILQSTPDGVLLIVAEEETPVPEWSTAAVARVINARLELISTSAQLDEQPGHNRFVVSDQEASGNQFNLDYQVIDAFSREIRLFVVPLADRRFVLTSTGGAGVTVEPYGVADLPVMDELVEFVAGSGRTERPVYGVSAMAWQRDDLGAVTWTEEGVLTAATDGYSLLKISYTSRYHRWIGRNRQIEEVQFVAEEIL